jgi:hypothetical protein
MSRTYRKTDYTDSVTKETYVREAIADWIKYPRRWKKRRLAKEVYEARIAEADRNLEARIAANRGSTEAKVRNWLGGWSIYTLRREYVSRWELYEVDVTREECIAEAEYDYAKYKRDCRFNETSLNTGFKKQTARDLRRSNRKFCRKAMVDEDYENTPMPIRKEGKTRIWDWW